MHDGVAVRAFPAGLEPKPNANKTVGVTAFIAGGEDCKNHSIRFRNTEALTRLDGF
jgi:hypothetical protein